MGMIERKKRMLMFHAFREEQMTQENAFDSGNEQEADYADEEQDVSKNSSDE